MEEEINNLKTFIKKLIKTFNIIIKWKAESENPTVVKTKNARIMLSSNCAVCNNKNSRFNKEQNVSRLFSSL